MVRILSAEEIAKAKKSTRYISTDNFHEHDDCIRIAYEWLDAQIKTKGPTRRTLPVKHIVEKWGERYVSQSDVEVAAFLHPEVSGRYPHFNISSRLTLPSPARLHHIAEAGAHPKKGENEFIKLYAREEPSEEA